MLTSVDVTIQKSRNFCNTDLCSENHPALCCFSFPVFRFPVTVLFGDLCLDVRMPLFQDANAVDHDLKKPRLVEGKFISLKKFNFTCVCIQHFTMQSILCTSRLLIAVFGWLREPIAEEFWDVLGSISMRMTSVPSFLTSWHGVEFLPATRHAW